jgi:hypothetical protein
MGEEREPRQPVTPVVVLAFGLLTTAFLVGMRFFIAKEER